MLRESFVPDERTLLDWITRIHAQGIRRPGYPADHNPDKVDAASLIPVTRAAIRVIESTRGVSAAAMRAGVL